MELTFTYVSQASNLAIVKREITKSRILGIDTETTGLDALAHKIRLLSIATADRVFLLDMFRLPAGAVKADIVPIFIDPFYIKIFHNAKFDLQFLQETFGTRMGDITPMFDTFLADQLLKGGSAYGSSLAEVSHDLLGVEMDKSFQKADWTGNLYKEQLTYAALDAAVLLPLYRILSKSLVENKLTKVAKLEFDCCPGIAQLELNGIGFDRDLWIDLAQKGKDRLYQLRERMVETFGDINFASNPQVAQALSAITGLDIGSTDAAALDTLILDYQQTKDLFGNTHDYRPAILQLKEYREEEKLQTSFGMKFLQHVHKKTGRVHPSYRQIGTNTGRMSCSAPNLQQIPGRGDAAVYRSAFVAPPGRVMWNSDYSQIELRGIAQFSRDSLFLRAFEEGADLHTLMASEMFRLAIEEVTPDQRKAAKVVTFGVPYGMGSSRLALKLGTSRKEAEKMLRDYYSSHPELVDWFEQQRQYFKQYDCVRSASGRLRALTNWRWDEYNAFQAAKNFPIQATSADITKRAVARCYDELSSDCKLVHVVHDELVVELPEEGAQELGKEVDRIMYESAVEFIPDVPILVDGHISRSWQK